MRIITTKIVCMVAILGFECCRQFAHAEPGVTNNKSLIFSGYVWKVKASEKRVGPGYNYFSDSTTNVRVDGDGKLHLKVSNDEGNWRCAEVISEKSFGFGTYQFYVTTPPAKLDKNLTLGLFTWSDASPYAHREIDVESGTWGRAGDTNNAQFVVQPYEPKGHLLRFPVPANSDAAYGFLWQSNSVQFRCFEGHDTQERRTNALIKEWSFTRSGVPQPGGENVRMNLWLSAGRFPHDTNYTEIVIAKFEFLPSVLNKAN